MGFRRVLFRSDFLIIAPASNICPWLEAQRVGRSGRATIVYDLISRGALEIGWAEVQPSAKEPLFSANFPSVRLLRSKRDVAIFGNKLVERRSLAAFDILRPKSGGFGRCPCKERESRKV